MSADGPALLWLRRDLRLRDHPALTAAAEHPALVPVFCLDDRLLHGRHASGSRTAFMLESLAELDSSLRERGSRLVVRHGAPERELPALAERVGASAVHFSSDVSPFARDRGQKTGQALVDGGARLHSHPGIAVVDDPAEVQTNDGRPQTIFTHYHRRWSQLPRREVLAAPEELPGLPDGVDCGELATLESLGLAAEVTDPAPGGESAARERMRAWLEDGVAGYADRNDLVAEAGTSRLSAYLRFGCISPRELESLLPAGRGPDAFRRQLCWRDFYLQLLQLYPGNARLEMQERYRGTIEWREDDEAFDAWTEGQTGFPLVDAAMRQLLREGWMHNRARLVVGSFLTKDLGIDWRRGERWFMRMLLDGDEANNNGNWQWIASVGADPQPASRRMFNPTRQLERFDPDGVYVRRYVPELREVPDDHIAQPWEMPEDVQRACGCVIGTDYPAPLVDHQEARRDALARYDV